MSSRKRRNRRRHKKSADYLNDIDLKMTREAIKRSGKRTTNYITKEYGS